MNLFDLFTNFCKLINEIELDTKTQALYFNLLHIFNQNYFPEELNIKTSELLNVLNINKRSFLNSRNILQQLNIIKYTQTNKFIVGVYSLVNFSEWCQNALVQNSTTSGAKETHPVVQNSTTPYIDIYNKLSKLKEKEKNKREKILSQKQLKFANAFPEKIIDCEVPEQIDIDLLIQKIKESEFLTSANNFTLQLCIKYYDKITQDFYKSYKQTNKPEFEQRTYTQEDINSLFTDLKDIKF